MSLVQKPSEQGVALPKTSGAIPLNLGTKSIKGGAE
jgi:hypothetical protein